MFRLAVPPRVASAAAVLCGRYGDVTRLARHRGVFRQTLYREAHAVLGALAPDRSATAWAALHRRVTALQDEVDRLRQQLQQADAVAADQVAAFAATAQALGVSLTAARDLLGVLSGATVPSLAQLGRLAHAAGRRASAALMVLDEFARPRAQQVAAAEIFSGKKPVLMTVAQQSLCWLGGRLAPSRDGDEWVKEFRQRSAAEQVTRDGGQGMEKGLQRANAERQEAGRAAVADPEDPFPILHRGRRGLRAVRHKAVSALHQAEQAENKRRRERRKGKVPAVGSRAAAVERSWQKAEAALDRWSAHAFERLRSGLMLFTPDGSLNTPARAEAEVQAALAELDGPEWSRRKHGLVGPKAFTFLTHVQKQRAALPVAAELRQAALRVEGFKRQPQAVRGQTEAAGALRGVLRAAGLVRTLAGAAGERAVALVQGVLRGAWRSSSLVEGLNSVLRRQQRRQKRLTQGLLDLKRLHWNLHVFRAGRRKRQSPYGRLGLVLPEGGWWQLLQTPPEQLRQQLSALNPAA